MYIQNTFHEQFKVPILQLLMQKCQVSFEVIAGRCEDSLELDLFLLQCCSVLAPPEEFVERIQARFALSEYFTLVLWRPNEYEKSAVGLLFGSLYAF